MPQGVTRTEIRDKFDPSYAKGRNSDEIKNLFSPELRDGVIMIVKNNTDCRKDENQG